MTLIYHGTDNVNNILKSGVLFSHKARLFYNSELDSKVKKSTLEEYNNMTKSLNVFLPQLDKDSKNKTPEEIADLIYIRGIDSRNGCYLGSQYKELKRNSFVFFSLDTQVPDVSGRYILEFDVPEDYFRKGFDGSNKLIFWSLSLDFLNEIKDTGVSYGLKKNI